ncbi:hypothetical protein STEG23_024648 [Scotinomys teguina]
MSAVMLLPGTNGSLLLVQRTDTRTIVFQETIGKGIGSQIHWSQLNPLMLLLSLIIMVRYLLVSIYFE